MMKILDKFNDVYYVHYVKEDPSNGPLSSIAIRPEFRVYDNGEHTVSWLNTSRGQSVKYQASSFKPEEHKTDKRFQITLENGVVIEFEFLNLELFNSKLRKKVAGGEQLKFESDEALQVFYKENDWD